MTPAAFKDLCSSIRLAWTIDKGLTVLLGNRKSKDVLRLCVAPSVNTGIVAEACVVWKGDRKVYNGAIDSLLLQQILTDNRICLAQTYEAVRVGSPAGRISASCYATESACAKCASKKCPVWKKAHGR